MGRWRALGARTKAAHARTLAPARGSRRGGWSRSAAATARCCWRCRRCGATATFDGFELSPPAIEIARGRGIPRAGRLEAYDGERVPADDGAYDLAVLSHVLEHVPDPAPLLREAARVARRVLVEVPLEDNRSAARPAKRAEAARIGHLHALNRARCAGAGSTAPACASPASSATRSPMRHHAFFAEGAAGRAKAAVKWGVRAGAWRSRRTSGALLHGALRSAGYARVKRRPATGESASSIASASAMAFSASRAARRSGVIAVASSSSASQAAASAAAAASRVTCLPEA